MELMEEAEGVDISDENGGFAHRKLITFMICDVTYLLYMLHVNA